MYFLFDYKEQKEMDIVFFDWFGEDIALGKLYADF